MHAHERTPSQPSGPQAAKAVETITNADNKFCTKQINEMMISQSKITQIASCNPNSEHTTSNQSDVVEYRDDWCVSNVDREMWYMNWSIKNKIEI